MATKTQVDKVGRTPGVHGGVSKNAIRDAATTVPFGASVARTSSVSRAIPTAPKIVTVPQLGGGPLGTTTRPPHLVGPGNSIVPLSPTHKDPVGVDAQGPEIVVGGVHPPSRPHEVAERKGKSWVCRHCSKLFKHSGSFNRHVHVVHEKHKPYKCPDCDKTFGMRSHLNIHTAAVHDKRRDCKCQYCDHAFADSSNLIKHVRARHKDRKDELFKCSDCHESFCWRYELSSHIKRVHQPPQVQ